MEDFLIFIGAGGSVPFGIPAMPDLVEAFEKNLDKKPLALKKLPIAESVQTIRKGRAPT